MSLSIMVESLCAVVLCKDESLHIRRCLDSLFSLTSKILVVDSFSTDQTLEYLSSYPCHVLQHSFVSHTDQFNWALDNLPWSDVSWVIRVDADELLSPNFSSLLNCSGLLDSPSCHAISVRRSFIVNGNIVRFAGLSPYCVRIVRSFMRYPFQIMDEHFNVSDDQISKLDACIYDHSLKPFSWWVEKHFYYAKNEAIQYLASLPSWRSLYPQLAHISKTYSTQQILYYKLPLFVRPFLFFFFRFIILFGFVNKPSSCRFLFFQCLIYRLLVDFWIAVYSFDKSSGDFSSFESDLHKICLP